jgi:ubiquinone/menaquinone biosynthesis C-methylase UbiE
MARRRAEQWVPFLLPHLRPGMRLLDVGCGAGGITLSLAERVAPGEVVGVEIAPSEVAVARAAAAERGLPNACFVVGSAYALPVPDGSFDAALACNTLEHLAEPLRALREMRRVLKPGGVVGVRDPDWSTTVYSPPDAIAEEALRLILQVRAHNGSSIAYSRHVRSLLLEAGFARAEALAIAEHWGTSEAVRGRIRVESSGWLLAPRIADVVLAQGWADRARLEALAEGARAWAERPDAFRAFLAFGGLGWVADDGASGV